LSYTRDHRAQVMQRGAIYCNMGQPIADAEE